MIRSIPLAVLMVVSTFALSAQGIRKEIKDYVNIEIFLENVWAGESITLIKEKSDYFILRKIFGSGVPVAGNFKYAVTFKSDYQIEFAGIIDSNDISPASSSDERFRMSIENDEVAVYLNGLKLAIKKKSCPEKRTSFSFPNFAVLCQNSDTVLSPASSKS